MKIVRIGDWEYRAFKISIDKDGNPRYEIEFRMVWLGFIRLHWEFFDTGYTEKDLKEKIQNMKNKFIFESKKTFIDL